MHLKHCYLLLMLLLPSLTSAQRQNLFTDILFFQAKAKEYQQWLEKKGLEKALKVDKLQFKTKRDGRIDSSEIELILLLTATDVDSSVGQWKQLKQEFDNDSDSLEAFLFRTFIHKMEIPSNQGNIQIYVRNQLGAFVPCFYVWIWSKNELLITQKKVDICKAETFDITIPAFQPKTSGRSTAAKVPKAKPRTSDQVFNTILNLVDETMLKDPRYQNELNDRRPYITDSLRTNNRFVFTVVDMGQEVLTNQHRIWWEEYVNINSIAMERLEFKFEYFKSLSEDNSFFLNCVIEGKYGSGIFKPRSKGYMNMENDFDDFFETYKNHFREALIKQFETRP